MPDGVEHPPVIRTGCVRDGEELVGDGELHVSPGVGEQLRQLGLERSGAHHLHAEWLEESQRAIVGIVARRTDQLWEAAYLLQCVTLGNAFRAEHDVSFQAGGAQASLDALGRSGEHCRTQHHQAVRPDVGDELVHHAVEDRDRRVHELVDGRAYDEDHGVGAVQHRRL